MGEQYPGMPRPTAEQLHLAVLQGMEQYAGVEFDEESQAEFATGNNFGSNQMVLGLSQWGQQYALSLRLGVEVERQIPTLRVPSKRRLRAVDADCVDPQFIEWGMGEYIGTVGLPKTSSSFAFTSRFSLSI